jgi:hypothetical protein
MGKPFYRRFDGMVWPAPSVRMGDLEWKLRHSPDMVTTQDMLLAASVIEAYTQMIVDPVTKRQKVIAELRKGPNIG